MNIRELRNSVKKSANRHIFNRFRTYIQVSCSVLYLAFSVIDYFYSPENFINWFYLRLGVGVSVFILFRAIVKFKYLRKRMIWMGVLAHCLYCWPICIMIYQSGGYSSLYSTGLILVGATSLHLLRLRSSFAMFAILLSYLPAFYVYFATVPPDKINLAFIQSGFLLGMSALSFVYGSSEEQVDHWWLNFKSVAKEEIARLQKTEVLKNHFPKVIRDAFEKNPNIIQHRKILPNAVVGFTDIVASSQISNVVPLAIDWEIKEKFLEAATKRAMECEMVVLTHLGDGFLFLANYNEGSQWYYNLITFYEALVLDFKKLADELNLQSTGIETGVKFGVSSGPVMVGFLGKNQSYFTAIGPDVNLASRLCGLAAIDEIVISTRVWHSVKPLIAGWDFHTEIYQKIKGFDYPISAVHISPRGSMQSSMSCSTCGGTMSLIKTEDGFMDYRCAEGHNTPALALEKSKIKKAS